MKAKSTYGAIVCNGFLHFVEYIAEVVGLIPHLAIVLLIKDRIFIARIAQLVWYNEGKVKVMDRLMTRLF